MNNQKGMRVLQQLAAVASIASAGLAFYIFYQSDSIKSSETSTTNIITPSDNPTPPPDIKEIQTTNQILNINYDTESDVSHDYKIVFDFPSSWGECLNLESISSADNPYSYIFDMQSIGFAGSYFSKDPLRIKNIQDIKLHRTEFVIEQYPVMPTNDEGYIDNPYAYSSQEKINQLEPLKKIYENEKLDDSVKKIIEGNEPYGGIASSSKYTMLWGNVDGFSDFFNITYISSADNMFRGLCSYVLTGQDYDFNLNYNCLMYNPELNIAVQIESPLYNVLSEDMSRDTMFKDAQSENDVINIIKDNKIKVINNELNNDTKEAVQNIKKVAESVSII